MIKKIPIGIDDYKKMVVKNCYYVDKTLLIKDLLSSAAEREVTLIPRPRRFGKTLNMSMLKYFFERTDENHAYLFEDKKIWQEKVREHQGQYPVIFLTLKSAKGLAWEEAYAHFKGLISHEFSRHRALIMPHFKPGEQKKYDEILDENGTPAKFQQSLLFLSQLLERAHNKKVILIIDEYDTPIVGGFAQGYYDEVVNFLRVLMTTSLKSNPFLERAFVTGISRIAKESIFSDLNNLAVFGLLNPIASDKFGFTEDEVTELLAYFNLTDKAAGYKEWYDGYRFGNHTSMYNPWAIFECMDHQNIFRPYWGGTSSNTVIKELVLRSSTTLKAQLDDLLQGRTFVQIIKASIIYPGIERDPDAIWNLLLYTGYLTFTEHKVINGNDYCRLSIPNQEMMKVYEEVVIDIMKKIIPDKQDEVMINALLAGDVRLLYKYLQKFLISSLSHFDKDYRAPENSYHMLMLGLTHGLLRNTYRAKSNPETGYGRADLLLIPLDTSKPAIAIEFKVAEKNESLSKMADEALQQIKHKQYTQELFDLGCQTIYLYGMAFSGKKVEVKMIEEHKQ